LTKRENQVTIQAAIDFMTQNHSQINRFEINRFVKRNNNVLTIQTANLLEKERHQVSEEDLRYYFDTVSIQSEKVPSLLLWNADETRVGIPKKCASSQVIVAQQTRPRIVTVPNERDDSELIMLTAITAFGDSTPPMFISKNKTFLSEALEEQQLCHDHDYVIRSSAKLLSLKFYFLTSFKHSLFQKTMDFVVSEKVHGCPRSVMALLGYHSNLNASQFSTMNLRQQKAGARREALFVHWSRSCGRSLMS
jgi:hypothetical protein